MTVTNKLLGGARARVLVVVAMAALMLALIPGGVALAAHFAGNTERVQGDSSVGRFGTAAAIALEAFPDGSDQAVVARGDIFADALAGSLLAGQLDAPILLSEGSRLTGITEETLDELAGNGELEVFLLGGTNALDTPVETRLQSLDFVSNVERVFGPSRYETAEEITATVGAEAEFGTAPENGEEGGEELTTGILATGVTFADALASAPLAFDGIHPLLLTTPDTLHAAAERALDDHAIEQVVIPGGENAVSAAVEAQVAAKGINVIRVNDEGGDRTSTAALLADLIRELRYEPYTGAADSLSIATGADDRGGADALALAPLAAKRQADLILTRGVNILDGSVGASGDPQPSTFIADNCEGFGSEEDPALLAGGTGAISAEVEAAISDLMICADFVGDGDLELSPEDATNIVGFDHTVTASGTNPKGDPAEGAGVTFEVYSDNELRADPENIGKTYVEDGVTYFFVESATATLDAEGNADFTYPQDEDDDGLPIVGNEPEAGDEDRIIACAPPSPTDPADFTCVNEDGDIPEGTPYGTAVASKSWVAADEEFDVFLFSGNEVAPEGAPEDSVSDADDNITGTAFVALNIDANIVCADIQMNATGSDPGSYQDSAGSHLHEGGPDVAGPVVVPWDAVSDETLASSSCSGPATDEGGDDLTSAQEVSDAPEEYYVNVHSSNFPNGAARGQLDGSQNPDPDPDAIITLAPAGEHEVGEDDPDSPNPLGRAGGPATGSATFALFNDFGVMCYEVQLDPTTVEGTFEGAAGTHIHEAPAGANGPVVLGLEQLDDDTASASGCARDVATDDEPSLIQALQDSPEDYYLNIHTTEWPGGAARAQFDGEDSGNPDM